MIPLPPFDAIALLDSGADVSAIPNDLANLLGLNLSQDIEETHGIGGTVRSIPTNITVIVEDRHGREKHTLSVPINVILETDDFPILLERKKFVITFDEQRHRVTLKGVNPN